MTPDTPTPGPTRDRQERPRQARLTTLVAIAAIAAVAIAATVAGAGATVTAQDGPTVRVTDASVDPGETATVRVDLTSAPEGLAGFELVLSVEGEAVTVVGSNYTDAFGLTTEPAVSDDGRSVRLEAADVGGNVEAGATDVTLATVELRGESAGEADIEVRPVQFDADGGARMDVGAEAGSVIVGEPDPTAAATDESGPTGGSASDGDADTTTAAPTNATISGQGGLPLTGLGVAGLALLVLGTLLARRR
jgi:hypothetical protein